MKRVWTVHTQAVPTREAERRLKQIYRLLVQWQARKEPSGGRSEGTGMLPSDGSLSEVDYASCNVCARFNAATRIGTNH